MTQAVVVSTLKILVWAPLHLMLCMCTQKKKNNPVFLKYTRQNSFRENATETMWKSP